MANDVLFERKLRSAGTSLVLGIPNELLRYIEAKEGDILQLKADKSKYGLFIGIWKENQQEGK